MIRRRYAAAPHAGMHACTHALRWCVGHVCRPRADSLPGAYAAFELVCECVLVNFSMSCFCPCTRSCRWHRARPSSRRASGNHVITLTLVCTTSGRCDVAATSSIIRLLWPMRAWVWRAVRSFFSPGFLWCIPPVAWATTARHHHDHQGMHVTHGYPSSAMIYVRTVIPCQCCRVCTTSGFQHPSPEFSMCITDTEPCWHSHKHIMYPVGYSKISSMSGLAMHTLAQIQLIC